MWHDTGNAAAFVPPGDYIQPDKHAESPDTKRRIKGLLDVTGLVDQMVRIKPRPATVEEVTRFHTPSHVDTVREMSAAGYGNAGENAPVGPSSYEIALLSTGGCIEAMDAVIDGRVQNAYALVRPPGHHACRDQGLGFCLFSNAALAIMHAMSVRGVKRVATVDWDVHHGNGTEQAFYDNPNVLTISIHQDNLYPVGTGNMSDTGEGEGRDRNINIPLPPGSGHGAYLSVFERVVLPALRRFQPELIVVPCGFDASAIDPLGRQMAYSDTYRAMTSMIKEVAREICDGRILVTHEGGYSPAYTPFCGLAV
ncbi:MAG TPA: class II histone deacetylase, partial [Arenicellales bacterium]|nr:class II histone deacetylase [Arenicellales bacterium]